MAKEKVQPPPRRKEPGLVAKTLGWLVSVGFWIVASLLVSIVIEWIGIAYFWSDEGSSHSKVMLQQDYAYLNERVADSANRIVIRIQEVTLSLTAWVERDFGIGDFFEWIAHPINANDDVLRRYFYYLHKNYAPYIESVPNTLQIFFVRLAIVILSLPAFALFAVIGMVDGLVERDLRRWGGGRESSVVYNLARKSILRFFIAACMIYLSFPITIAPAWIIIPFALAFGLSIRVSFERFKKYF